MRHALNRRRLCELRKPLRRLRRDAALLAAAAAAAAAAPRQRRALALAAAAAAVALVLALLLLLLLLLPSLPRRLAERRLRRCACAAPAAAPRAFAAAALQPPRGAAFVARVVPVGTTDASLRFRVHTLFQAPLAVAALPLRASAAQVLRCAAPPPPPPPPPSAPDDDPSFLLLAAAAAPDPRRAHSALLRPAPPPCPRLAAPPRVFLFPWHALPPPLVRSLHSNPARSPAWWRARAARRSAAALLRNLSRPSPPWVRPGLSIVAACKDRSHLLNATLPSWLAAAPPAAHIVLIDWASHPPIRALLPRPLLQHPRLRLVSVLDQPRWHLAAAYNLAVHLTTTDHVLKLDCDTVLHPSFFRAHPLTPATFFAGDWHQLPPGASEKLHANGLLFVARHHFLAAGGYDERITTYGWDDSDIVSRLSAFATARPIHYHTVTHLSHNASLRIAHSHALLPADNPFAAAVEIQRNRLLITRSHLPPWHPTAPHLLWNMYCVPPQSPPAASPAPPCHLFARAASTVTPALQLVSEADALDVSKRAIRLILRRLGVELLPKTLSLPFYKQLIHKLAFAPRYARVVFSLRGGCVARLLAHAHVKHVTDPAPAPALPLTAAHVSPPPPYKGWRIQELWHFPTPQCSCKFFSPFSAVDEEMYSIWSDTINPLPPALHRSAARRNATELLLSFDTLAVAENVSENVSRWDTASHNQSASRPRILFAQLACHPDPSQLTAPQISAIRAHLRRITPSETMLEMLHDTQPTSKQCALDSQLLTLHSVQQLLAPLSSGGLVEPNWGAFTSPPLMEMAKTWSPAFVLQREPRSAKRALSLYNAMYLSHHLQQLVVADNAFNNTTFPDHAQRLISQVSTTVEPLFTGCSAPAFPYLHAYPELAMIVASFVCTGMCV